MKTFFDFLPFALVGGAIGNGQYGVSDWRWWAWMAAITVALMARDEVLK